MNSAPATYGGLNDSSCHDTRIVYLGDAELASEMHARILMDRIVRLSAEKHDPILLVINSGGGSPFLATAMVDLFSALKAPVHTQVFGLSASAACITSACGRRGHRWVSPMSRVMMHQPWVMGVAGDTTQLEIEAEEMRTLRAAMTDLMATVTKKTSKSARAKLDRDMERDYWMSADEAVTYGLADHMGVHPLFAAISLPVHATDNSGMTINLPLAALQGRTSQRKPKH